MNKEKLYNPELYSSLDSPESNDYLIDLDNTLSENVYPLSVDGIGAPIEKNIKKLQEVSDAGYGIFIWTSRPGWHKPAIKKWCDKYLGDIKVLGILTSKDWGFRYVDDKAVNSEEASWL